MELVERVEVVRWVDVDEWVELVERREVVEWPFELLRWSQGTICDPL